MPYYYLSIRNTPILKPSSILPAKLTVYNCNIWLNEGRKIDYRSTKYIEDWDERNEQYRKGIVEYWKKEINERDRAIERRKVKLRERGELYE